MTLAPRRLSASCAANLASSPLDRFWSDSMPALCLSKLSCTASSFKRHRRSSASIRASATLLDVFWSRLPAGHAVSSSRNSWVCASRLLCKSPSLPDNSAWTLRISCACNSVALFNSSTSVRSSASAGCVINLPSTHDSVASCSPWRANAISDDNHELICDTARCTMASRSTNNSDRTTSATSRIGSSRVLCALQHGLREDGTTDDGLSQCSKLQASTWSSSCIVSVAAMSTHGGSCFAGSVVCVMEHATCALVLPPKVCACSV
mmetsp:Transcript_36277/g.91350  ORF Transcript_36277/g.91350 Transcript_36277/m.91350 type:complete len:264 (+) Transcript_36277:1282-2073(+)